MPPPADPDGASPSPAPAHPDRIGPFRILSRIGEGGMGIVYEAEQERPSRRVALKIVRPGAVPAHVLRRFELEYELLGRLQHPGIAQIYQAGIADTEYGPQPYFAMELVRGKRLDDYLRAAAPPLHDRLVLVAAIADAVQHAHHRGIIHRDLKPANILVTDAGAPKVLDFGIARVAAPDDVTRMPTAAGEVLGTLQYMSPEQVAGDAAALDTRSDVYALGVILYEVIAGRPPYALDRRSFAEAARIIHDVEPAPLRAVAPGVPADVETIAAKALEKEKERRYSSAGELAEDIRRFLRDEPIAARPASAVYQVRKFARRHKALVAGVLASVALLVGGIATTTWQAVRALRAERVAAARAEEAENERARAEAVTGFLTEMLASVDPSQAQGRDVSVRDALDAAAARIEAGAMAEQPAVELAVRQAIGETYGSLGLYEPAERQLRAAMAIEAAAGAGPLVRADTRARLVNVLYLAGKYADAVPPAREALDLRRAALGPSHPLVASSLDDLGAVLMVGGDLAQAEPLMREALAIKRRQLQAGDPEIAVGLNNLAFLVWRQGNLTEAEAMYREALAMDRARLGGDHPEVATKLTNLALLLRDQGRPDEAEPFAREALAIRRRILGAEHPGIAIALDVLAGVVEGRGRTAEAVALMREALAIARRSYGEAGRDTARMRHNLAWLLWKAGAYAEAAPLARAAFDAGRETFGPHRVTRGMAATWALALNGRREHRAAERAAREALAMYRQAPDDPFVVSALVALGQALVAGGRAAEGEPYLREALAAIDRADASPVRARHPWWRGEIESALGEALAAQGRHDEAERLLLAGYDGLRAHASAPAPCVRVAIERLAAFYASRGREADSAAWRARL